MPQPTLSHDRHALYEAAVQGVDWDLDFLERVYRRHTGRAAVTFREDFCGTAALSGAWVARGPKHVALGFDLDREVLAWARKHRLPWLHEAARRVTLRRADVRTVTRPRVDLACALNFSYWVFKRRAELLAYFRAVRRSLAPDGLLVVNAFGGTDAERPLVETTRKPASNACDGSPLPPFTFVWEHASLNPVTREIVCHIHFRFRGGRTMRNAFTYDWRMWTLPEIQEAMLEAGFHHTEVWAEGWNDRAGEADGRLRVRRSLDNEDSWVVYVAGYASAPRRPRKRRS